MGKEAAKETKVTQLSSTPFEGFREFITHKRLIGISAFIFIFVGIGSFYYLAQKDILSDYPSAERKEILGRLDLYINFLTIFLGLFATNRIARKFGLSTALPTCQLTRFLQSGVAKPLL